MLKLKFINPSTPLQQQASFNLYGISDRPQLLHFSSIVNELLADHPTMLNRFIVGIAGLSVAGAFIAPELVKSLASTVKPTTDYHAIKRARETAVAVQSSLQKPENFESKSSEEREEYDRHDYCS